MERSDRRKRAQKKELEKIFSLSPETRTPSRSGPISTCDDRQVEQGFMKPGEGSFSPRPHSFIVCCLYCINFALGVPCNKEVIE